MRPFKYPESIVCAECNSHVKMVNCRLLEKKIKGKVHVEFDCVCISCGVRASTSRDFEYLQFSEREFCKSKGLEPAGSGLKVKV